jgi:tellurite resistance protein TerC
MVNNLLKQARRVVIGIIGFTVLLIGVALLVLPGPAFIVIPAGLAILAIEFAWARRWLERIKQTAAQTGDRLFRKSTDNQRQKAENP